MPIHNALHFEPQQQAAATATNPAPATPGAPAPMPGQPSPRALQIAGPTLSVEISLHPNLVTLLQQQSQPVPQPITGRGLIDTGATITAVDMQVLTQLQIAPVGTMQVGTAGGQQTQQLYPAAIRFPEIGFAGQFTSVLGADLTGQGFLVLIGRDVLSRGLFVYNGNIGHFILSF